MKINSPKIIFAIILSSLLNVSCGNEVAIEHIANCASILESCEENCKPTQVQLDAFINCDQICFFNHKENGFDSYYECRLFCETEIYGSETPYQCEKKCKEAFYECVFGPDWKDLNIKRP